MTYLKRRGPTRVRLERWTRVGYERGMRSRKGERVKAALAFVCLGEAGHHALTIPTLAFCSETRQKR